MKKGKKEKKSPPQIRAEELVKKYGGEAALEIAQEILNNIPIMAVENRAVWMAVRDEVKEINNQKSKSNDGSSKKAENGSSKN